MKDKENTEQVMEEAALEMELHMIKELAPQYEYLTVQDLKTYRETGYLRPNCNFEFNGLKNLIDDGSESIDLNKIIKRNGNGTNQTKSNR